MALFLPQGWRRLPQFPVLPNEYWLDRGLVFLFNGATFSDLVSQTPVTSSTGVGKGAVSADASGPLITDVNTRLTFANSNRLNVTGDLSIIWRGTPTAGSGKLVSKATGSGTTATPYDFFVNNFPVFIKAGATTYRQYTVFAAVPSGAVTFGFLTNAGMNEAVASKGYINTESPNLTLSGTSSASSATSNTNPLYIGRSNDNLSSGMLGTTEYIALFNKRLTDAEYLRIYSAPWVELVVPLPTRRYFIGTAGPPPVVGSAKSAGGGAARAVGNTAKTGTGKAAGGGAARAVGATTKSGTAAVGGGGATKAQGTSAVPVVGSAKSTGGGATTSAGVGTHAGTAKSAGGGTARAQGSAAVLHTAAVAGGGAATSPQGVPGHTSTSVAAAGGGAARAFGVQNVGIIGRAYSAGGGAAVSATLANRVGWAIAGGGGAARATAQSATHSGFAAAAGGGATRAIGGVPPPPGLVDHYTHGWPVNKDGALLVRIMP